jgi:DNA-binding IclR family transcriptional regulator
MVLKSVASQIEETCNVAAPSVAGMTYLDRVDTPWPLRFQLPVGTEVPFHCTASGKLFLASFTEAELTPLMDVMELSPEGPNSITDKAELRAEIRKIREAGYSWDNEEFMAGMVAFAVPVEDHEGRFACALAFHAPMQRIGFEEARAHVPILREGANRIKEIIFAEDQEA